MKSKYLIAVLALFTLAGTLRAQSVDEAQIESYKAEVNEIVSFLQYMMNTLGDKQTSARDKDVIVTASYKKVFRDAQVQVEDDLDENRDVITNKDVSAYLKDIEFFFKDVEFEFDVEDITYETNDDGNLYFKVAMVRNLKGLTIKGDSVNNTSPRYIEVNYDPEAQDLKIASIYTHKYSQKKALTAWWKNLSYEWRAIFKRKYEIISDSISLDQIQQFVATDTLNLSNNKYIISIEPLGSLTNLKKLDISRTGVSDVGAIRNLTRLQNLDISHTAIENIEKLKYCRALQILDITGTTISKVDVLQHMTKLENALLSDTKVWDVSVLGQLSQLKRVEIRNTGVRSLVGFEKLDKLTHLDASKTEIFELSPLDSLSNLEWLNLDSTSVGNLDPIARIQSLKVLSINYTPVSTIEQLGSIEHLERIYCDHTALTEKEVHDFLLSNPGVLVIFDSKDMRGWWLSLNDGWRSVFTKNLQLGTDPSKEQLAQITTIDSISLSGRPDIKTVEPLRRLSKLKAIDLSGTEVADLTPIENNKLITYLDISNTPVADFQVLKGLNKLTVLKADKTLIESIDLLLGNDQLQTLYLDETPISTFQVSEFLSTKPETLIVFESADLLTWWSGLSDTWKKVLKVEQQPTTEELHKLTQSESVSFSDLGISSLEPLNKFIRLKELSFNKTSINSLNPVTNHPGLTKLTASNSPISELEPLESLTKLESLDISNTPVEDLDALENLTNLREVNCSGTQIKKLNDLELHNLKSVDCSNTRVKRLDPVQYISLEKLVCYNTRVNDRRIEKFKEDNPDCDITYY